MLVECGFDLLIQLALGRLRQLGDGLDGLWCATSVRGSAMGENNKERERDRETERQTDRQADRQTEKGNGATTHTHTHTQRSPPSSAH